MIDKLRKSRAGKAFAALWGRLPVFIRSSRVLSLAFVLILANTAYWLIVASPRYVSEASVVIDSTDSGSVGDVDLSSMLVGMAVGRDLQLLQDFLLSSDMAERLDARFDLRGHYSDWRRDPLSRLWFRDTARERFYSHYLSRVEATAEVGSEILRIRVQAYSPEMAQAVAQALVQEGERFMNELAHGLAREQVKFLDEEVQRMGARLQEARGALLAYQDAKGYVSPQAAVEGLSSIVNQMEGDLAKLRAERGALLGYLSPSAPDVVRISLQISGLEEQLARAKGRLASPQGKALNSVAEEYQRLQMEAQFAQDVYQSAIVALQKGRLDVTRTMKKVSVVQTPQRADRAVEPHRLYHVVIYALLILLVAGIIRLLGLIVSDHKD